MPVKPNVAVMAAAYRDLLILEELVTDLRHIALGNAPNDEDLESAPLLDPWSFFSRQQLCLAGCVTGHPLLKGPRIVTSHVWSCDPEAHWARTLSRFYRLGKQRSGGLFYDTR